MRVLVTGTSTIFSPPLIQNLGVRGVEVTAADSRLYSVGKACRNTTRRLRLPLLSRNPAGYLKTLLQEVSARSYDLLLPAFEESLLLAEYRHIFEPFTRLLLPPFESMWRVHDKRLLYGLCQDLHIPAPPTVIPRNSLGIEQQVAGLRFPVVLKLPTANNCVGRTYCENLPDLVEQFQAQFDQEVGRGAAPPFIQQKIDGDPIYTLMLCDAGRKLGEVIYRPLRTYPERGGTSAHRESIEHPRIAALTDRLAAATGWSGFLGTDFIVDRVDGTPYLIDANPRPTPGVQLGYLAGIDWTGILVNLLEGRPCTPAVARSGVRTRSILLDLGWLFEGCGPQKNWPSKVRERFAKYCKPDWHLDARNEFLSKSEWRCGLALTGQGIVGALKALMTRRSIGQTMLDDVNYDAVSAEQLRRSIEAYPFLLPAPVHSSTHSMRISA